MTTTEVKMPTKTEWLAETKKVSGNGGEQLPEPSAPNWTVWQEASSMRASLNNLAEHYRRVADQLEKGLMEGERLIGSMPKRP